jgi:uncharacterized membrane protein
MAKARKANFGAALRSAMRAEPLAQGQPLSMRRFMVVDIARGVAIALMFVYHVTFDLNYFGVVAFDFNNDLRWLGFRAVNVSLFSALIRVSRKLAMNDQFA